VDSYIEKLLLKSTKNNVANYDIAKFDKRRDKNYWSCSIHCGGSWCL